MSVAEPEGSRWNAEAPGFAVTDPLLLRLLNDEEGEQFSPEGATQAVFDEVVRRDEAARLQAALPVPRRWIEERDTLRLFLRDVGKRFQLSAPEEVALAYKVRASQQVAATLAPYAPNEQEKFLRENPILAEHVQEGTAARDILFRHNVALIVSVAKKFTTQDLELADLVQEGARGLQQAIESFDPQKDCRFSTHAQPKVFAACRRYVQEHTGPWRTPPARYDDHHRIQQYRTDLRSGLQREPTLQEIAEAARQTEQKIAEILAYIPDYTPSLDAPFGDGNDAWKDRIGDQVTTSVEDTALENVRREAVLQLVDRLPEVDRNVLVLRFGLGGVEPMTLEAAGQALGLNLKQVQWIEKRALVALKKKAGNSWMDWLQ